MPHTSDLAQKIQQAIASKKHEEIEKIFKESSNFTDEELTIFHQQIIALFGSDFNQKIDEKQQCLLHYAATVGRSETINFLLNEGADIEAKEEDGHTPLMLATALDCDVELVRTLVKRGADLEAKDKRGCTSLSFSAQGEKSDVLRFLLQHGNKDVVTRLGYNLLQLALNLENIRMA